MFRLSYHYSGAITKAPMSIVVVTQGGLGVFSGSDPIAYQIIVRFVIDLFIRLEKFEIYKVIRKICGYVQACRAAACGSTPKVTVPESPADPDQGSSHLDVLQLYGRCC
jgi:hypothetical protein